MKTLFAFAFLAALPAAAQAPVTVYYAYDQSGANRWMVDKAIRAVMEHDGFQPAARRDSAALELAVEGKVVRDPGEDSKGFSFTLGFYHGGEKLGEAAEYCRTDKMSECIDQLVSDIGSASSIHR